MLLFLRNLSEGNHPSPWRWGAVLGPGPGVIELLLSNVSISVMGFATFALRILGGVFFGLGVRFFSQSGAPISPGLSLMHSPSLAFQQ